jgi:hypothetical protein
MPDPLTEIGLIARPGTGSGCRKNFALYPRKKNPINNCFEAECEMTRWNPFIDTSQQRPTRSANSNRMTQWN